jgi:hypothetical protein
MTKACLILIGVILVSACTPVTAVTSTAIGAGQVVLSAADTVL